MDLNKFKKIAEIAAAAIETFDDAKALENKELYISFDKLIGLTVPVGYKFTYEDKLYKTRQDNLLIQEQYKPSIDTASLYEEINEVNQGTLEDPIPYNNNMELFEGLYYIQNEVIYKCTRSTGTAVFHNLKDLVGLYVETVE